MDPLWRVLVWLYCILFGGLICNICVLVLIHIDRGFTIGKYQYLGIHVVLHKLCTNVQDCSQYY